jgi:3-oxoacyl-[acyl-carrier protein] reductase
MDLGIRGKVALVTGGSKGIGKASALELAKEGCNIVISARTKADLLQAEKEIGALGVKTLAVPADLEKPEDVERLVSSAFDKFGRVDILFNNAGYSHPTTPISTTDQEWYNLLNIHLMACVRTCRLIIPKMLEQKWGRVINMASICGIAPMSGLTNYNACKAAVISASVTIFPGSSALAR